VGRDNTNERISGDPSSLKAIRGWSGTGDARTCRKNRPVPRVTHQGGGAEARVEVPAVLSKGQEDFSKKATLRRETLTSAFGGKTPH